MLPLIAFKNTVFVLLLSLMACGRSQPRVTATEKSDTLLVAANRTRAYFPLLEGKEFALVANQTSVIFTPDGGWVHLADSLLQANLQLKKVFAPEHGSQNRTTGPFPVRLQPKTYP